MKRAVTGRVSRGAMNMFKIDCVKFLKINLKILLKRDHRRTLKVLYTATSFYILLANKSYDQVHCHEDKERSSSLLRQ